MLTAYFRSRENWHIFTPIMHHVLYFTLLLFFLLLVIVLLVPADDQKGMLYIRYSEADLMMLCQILFSLDILLSSN